MGNPYLLEVADCSRFVLRIKVPSKHLLYDFEVNRVTQVGAVGCAQIPGVTNV